MYSRRLKSLTPYTPGEQPRDRAYIKLNTNENPYPPAPGVRTFLNQYDAEELKLYPDPESKELRAALASGHGLSIDEVFVSNGSDESLALIFGAFFDSEMGPVIYPDHTYSFYPVYCGFWNVPSKPIALNPDFKLDLAAYGNEPDYSGIIFPNPNAPTGCAVGLESIRKLLDRVREDRVVVIDEAYVDFGTESADELIDEYPNLLVVRTFSKSRSLAGMRIGYVLGQAPLIKALTTMKDSFNSYPVNTLSQRVAILSLQDRTYFDETRTMIQKTREEFTAKTRKLGFNVPESRANFIFASKPGIPGHRIYNDLRERGILVRHFNHPGIEDYVRITIGTDKEMETAVSALEELYG